jgi:hypothetical protein
MLLCMRPITNPVPAAGLAVGVVILGLLGVGIYLIAKPNTPPVPTPPSPSAVPNFYPGPNGEILQAVGPYGVPFETIQA